MAWPNRHDQLRRVIPVLRGQAPILDLGCGDGVLLDLLKGVGERGEGVERNESLARSVRARGHTVHEADVLAYVRGGKPGRYGAVVAAHIVEHLPPPQLPEFLSGCARSLRGGGKLLILTPNPRNIGVITQTFWGDLEHRRPYSLDLMVRLVGEAGLNVLEAGEDPYTRQPGLLRRPLNLLRRLLVGNYWGGADLLVFAEKPAS